MPSFSQKISVPKTGTYTFTFTRIYTVDGIRYFVTVTDEGQKMHQFFMRQIEESWILVDTHNLPDWLIALEFEFEKVILNH